MLYVSLHFAGDLKQELHESANLYEITRKWKNIIVEEWNNENNKRLNCFKVFFANIPLLLTPILLVRYLMHYVNIYSIISKEY